MTERPARTEKKSKNTVLWGIIVLGLLLLLGTAAGMIRTSYPDLISDAVAKLTFTDTASSEARPSQAPATDSYVGSEFGYQDVERLLETLTPVRRAEVLGDADAFDRLVREESVRQSVLEAARAAGFTQNARVIYLMERAAAQVLFNTFMQTQASSKLPADFPSEAQIRKHYEQNRARYRFEQHVPVWQVFIGVSAEASTELRARKEMFASDLSIRIRAGTLSFSDAALSYSEHEASRIPGGYMGAIRISQLLPEVRAAIPQLEEDEVSPPIRTRSGYHIIKRGAVMAARDVPLDQIRGTIRLELRRAALREIQQAVVSASAKQYGKLPAETELEEWRTKLAASLTQTN